MKCRECNAPLEGSARKEFCDDACRKAWNNRRMVRGAELYDLFMGCRFDRERAQRLGCWSAICRLASEWQAADAAAGRHSHGNIERIMSQRPYLKSTRFQ